MPTIVAAVDATPRGGPVLRWAAREAVLTGARAVAVTASGGSEQPGPELDAMLRRCLDICVDSFLPPDLAASTERAVRPERPFEALLKASVEADLLVMGARRDHPPWAAHELTARVLALAGCPVAVVRGRAGPATGRIAVGIDGSPASLAALRWASRRAEHTGADLLAVTAWHWTPECAMWPSGPSEHDSETAAVEILNETLDQGPDARCHRIVDQGHPVDALLDFSRHVDLIVVGSNGTGAFDSQLFGSVSQRVAQRASCPTVIVHDTDEAAPL